MLDDGVAASRSFTTSKWWPIPRRSLLAYLGFFGFVHVYVMRFNMSFAVVAMTANYSTTDDDGNVTYVSDFEWSSTERGIILSSFFYGYITTQILGGFLVSVIGPSRLYCAGVLGTAVLTVITPVVATAGGLVPLVVIRVLEGVFQGVVFPAMHELWSYWAPPLERTKLLSITHSGTHIGTFFTMAVCGIVSEYLGWPWIFYIFGATGIVWCAVWTWCIYDEPSKDPSITVDELEYITSSIGHIQRLKFLDAPWKSILTSMPIWAVVIAHTVQNSGFYTMLTQLPTFLNDVAGWRLDKMGLLAAIPYVFMAIVVQSAGQLADTLRGRFQIETGMVRKVFTCGCYLVQMSFLLITAHVTDSPTVVIVCLTIAVASGGFASYSVNHLDLAPQYASLTFGLANTFATLPGMISPTVTGYLVQNKLASEWLNVFYITSGVYLFGAIFYVMFASGERQPWAISSARDLELTEAMITKRNGKNNC